MSTSDTTLEHETTLENEVIPETEATTKSDAPPENTGQKQDGRFKKGQSGNPAGKPHGARNRATLVIEALLEGQASALGKKLTEMALDGDSTAMRLCIERLISARRDRPVEIDLPPLKNLEDAVAAHAEIIAATARGSITPSEAVELGKLVDSFVTAVKTRDLEELEGKEDRKRIMKDFDELLETKKANSR